MSKEKTNLPISIEDEIKRELAAQSKQLGDGPSNKIATKGKVFTLPDGQSDPGPLQAVILDYTWYMVHYPGVYNANNPQQPNCFAIGRDKPESGLLQPHEGAAQKQGSDCKTCPKNQWKSGNGNGKACKNQRRLVLVAPDATEDTVPMIIYVSPGALKNFDAYVSRLKNEHGILPVQAITEISFDPNQSYPSLMFKFANKHNNLNLFWALKERAQDQLFRPIESEAEKKAAA